MYKPIDFPARDLYRAYIDDLDDEFVFAVPQGLNKKAVEVIAIGIAHERHSELKIRYKDDQLMNIQMAGPYADVDLFEKCPIGSQLDFSS